VLREVMIFSHPRVLDIDVVAPHAPTLGDIGISVGASALAMRRWQQRLVLYVCDFSNGAKLLIHVLRTGQQLNRAFAVFAFLHGGVAYSANTRH
jgi:hypothetical protein